jgi:ubiquinone/menaquinone biosynthesis C-methylase UbiE
VVSRKRSHRLEKLAQIYDDEILPVWAERFGRMLLRDLPLGGRIQILDVSCSTGFPAVEIIRRMGTDGRLIAIDPVSALLDVARKKVEKLGARGVFFRTESAEPKLSFADDVYDLVISNLGLVDREDPARAIADFARVTKPGGQVRCTLPLAGTFQEFYDIYREVLTKHDKHDTLDELNAHIEEYATVDTVERWLRDAPLIDGRVEQGEFTLLFRSSREFFFAPVIEYGPLAAWKQIAGRGQEMQDVFWYIKEAIDAYFEGRAFEITIKAGCLIGTKPTPEQVAELALGAPAVADASGPVELLDPEADLIEASEDEIDTIDRDLPPTSAEPPDSLDEIPLDAFVEGAERPEHLSPPSSTDDP